LQNVSNSRQVCQINLDTRYQNGLKYTKRPWNRPNGQIETNIFHKFGLKIYNLATPTPTRAPRQCTYSPTYVVQFLLNSRPTFFANVFVNRYLDEIDTANNTSSANKIHHRKNVSPSLFSLARSLEEDTLDESVYTKQDLGNIYYDCELHHPSCMQTLQYVGIHIIH
jgi:hypothetical protein